MNFDSFFFRSPPARSSFLVSLLSLSLSLARALALFLSLLLLQQQQQERQRARRDSRCGEHQGKEREREKQREGERNMGGHAENSTSPLFFSPLVSRRDAAGRRKTTASSSACGLFPDFASHTVAFFFPVPKQPRQQTNGASIHVPCGADLLWRETTLSANPFLSSLAPCPLSAGPRPPSPPVPFLASR